MTASYETTREIEIELNGLRYRAPVSCHGRYGHCLLRNGNQVCRVRHEYAGSRRKVAVEGPFAPRRSEQAKVQHWLIATRGCRGFGSCPATMPRSACPVRRACDVSSALPDT